MKPVSILVSLAACFILGTAGVAAAQNVVVNGDFSTGDLTGWTAGVGTFSSSDCCATVPPGSVTGTASSNGLKNVISQCVTYDATANPSFGFGGYIAISDASGGGAGSQATITAQFNNGAACAGTNVGLAFVVGPQPITLNATQPFTLAALTAQTTPVGALSALITVQVKRAGGGSIVANFDRIFLGNGLTSPVTLQHFDAK